MILRLVIVVLVIGLNCKCIEGQSAISDFLAIDCGGSVNYADSNGMNWISDNSTDIDGEVLAVDPPEYIKARANSTSPLSSIRFFPGGYSKYCYVFGPDDYNISKNSAYLIRASFWAGSAFPDSTISQNTISFKLLIYTDEWETVQIDLPQKGREVNKEIYVIAIRDEIEVCLARTSPRNSDTPFISSLILRKLDTELSPVNVTKTFTEGRPLILVKRTNYGVSDEAHPGSADIRYFYDETSGRSDTYDRIWEADTTMTKLNTSVAISYGLFPNDAPTAVMQTARQDSNSFILELQLPPFSSCYYFLYFANIYPSADRRFSYTVDSVLNKTQKITDFWNSYNSYETIVHYPEGPMSVSASGSLIFTFNRSAAYAFGPLINAIEIFKIFNKTLSSGTADEEVSVVRKFTRDFQSLRNWTGDPCLPSPYNWISCTNESLPHIEKIDLHGNNLTGNIPSYLGDLPALKTLDLSNNNFIGDLPESLLSKANDNKLNLSLAGNAQLCGLKSLSQFCGSSQDQKIDRKVLIIVVPVMVVVCVILGVTLTVVYIKRKTIEEVNVNEQSQRDAAEASVEMSRYARKFSYEEIKFITRNFENVIGRGAFGHVYEGELRNGLKVAVKMLSKSSTQGKKEFVNEVRLLSRVHHTNLVRLLGYSDESELVLVYEYMVNGSVAYCLHGGGVYLRVWKDRLRVAAGAAEGLEYLHRGCDPPIIHRDIKSSNILLNQNFTAKISDFGISKSRKSEALAMTDSYDTFTIVRGTRGYLDPLYEETQVADASVDVYAFGVLLFELVTGRRPMIDGMSGNERPIHIVQWAKPYIERNQLEGILDPRMCQVVNISSAWKVMEIAFMCVDINKNMRPTMGEVRKELESALSMEVPEDSSTASPLDIPKDYGCESIIQPR